MHLTPSGPMQEDERPISWIVVTTVFAILLVITMLRFAPWQSNVFYADDLFNYMYFHGDRATSPVTSIWLAPVGQKFRPVFATLMTLEISFFAKNFWLYILTNAAINAGCATLLFLATLRASGSWTVACTFAIFGACVRFALYQATQATGLVESVALLFCMATVFVIIGKENRPLSNKQLWLSLLFATLAFNTHERYVVLLPWLSIFFLFATKENPRGRRSLFVLLCCLIVASNVAVKHFVYHANFFQGTANTPLAINLELIRKLFHQAIFSVFGLNAGPSYLTGIDWLNFSHPARDLALAFPIVTGALLLFGMGYRARTAQSVPGGRSAASLVTLFILLFIPPLLTIRMEQRWELAPFYVLLILLAWSTQSIQLSKHRSTWLAISVTSLVIGWSATEYEVSRNLQNVFFVKEGRFASNVKRAIIDAHSSSPGSPVVIVATSELCQTALLDGEFFTFYESHYRVTHCVESPIKSPPSAYPAGTRAFATTDDGRLLDITDRWPNDFER